MDLVHKDSYTYQRLLEEFPDQEPFYSVYVQGDYYNKAHVDYYDKNLRKIATHDCGYYG